MTDQRPVKGVTTPEMVAGAAGVMLDPAAPATRYYTFGFNHAHAAAGVTFDKDVVVKITAQDPRARMIELFGREWSMEYKTIDDVDLRWYPRGVVELS